MIVINAEEYIIKIQKQYEHLKSAMLNQYGRNEELLEAKSALEKARLHELANGTITGKNPEERAASAQVVLQQQYTIVEQKEALYREAKLRLDNAQADVEEIRLEMRLYELLKN